MSAPLAILHADDDLIVVSKPAGLMVHRNAHACAGERFVLQVVSEQVGRYLFPVHRLDRNTSGVLVFALSRAAAASCQERLAAGAALKEYLVLVRGETPAEFVSERPLLRPDGTPAPARSEFCRLAGFSRCSLLRATIRTGRHRQIRRHLNHLAHQVIGDSSHGKGRINRFFRDTYGLPRMFLHASRLRVPHPRSAALLELIDPLPADLREFLGRLPDVDRQLLARL